MHKIPTVLFVSQLPPPFHGQSIMNQFFLEGIYTKIKIHHVRMAFSNDIQEVGAFRWKKLFHLFHVILSILVARMKTGASILYYPPASPNKVPFLRDCVLLIATRWAFGHTVFHFHANGLADLYARLNKLLKVFFWLAYKKPSVSIAVSNYGRIDGDFIKSRKVVVVPNGIPDEGLTERITLKSSDMDPIILFCGIVSEEKGVGSLLEACLALKQKGLRFKCIIVGRAALEAEELKFRNFIKQNGLGGMVEIRGPLYGSEKWNAFKKSDIFCFPTFYSTESFGLVAVEAMMFSLPVVASNWRGLPDIVVDGKTGFLVPPKDYRAIAAKLELLVNDPKMRRGFGSAGRRRYVELFKIEKFRLKMETIFLNIDDLLTKK